MARDRYGNLITGTLDSVVYPTGIKADANGVTDLTVVTGNTFSSPSAKWKPGQTLVIRRAGNGSAYVATIANVPPFGAITTSGPPCPFTGSGLTAFYGTDDTAAWQSALNSAVPGQAVDAGPAFRSLISAGSGAAGLVIPTGVQFGLYGRGPFDPQSNPAMDYANASVGLPTGPGRPAGAWGPTFVCVQSTTQPSIGFGTASVPCYGGGLGDVILYSANQANRNATVPNAFASTVEVQSYGSAGIRIGRPYIPNAWTAFNLAGGRHYLEHPQIGALNRGIYLDQCLDFVRIGGVDFTPYWDVCEGGGFLDAVGKTGFDTYAMSTNGLWCIELCRCDGFHAQLIEAFSCYGALLCDDSTIGAEPDGGPKCGHGTIGQIQCDATSYGIYAQSIEAEGLLIGEMDMNGNNIGVGRPGQYGVITVPGGASTPQVGVAKWSIHNTINNQSNGAGTIVGATNGVPVG